jgi:hypothetical protein
MSLIAIRSEPSGATRIFFDCRPIDPDPRDEARITRVIVETQAIASVDPLELPRAA